MVKRIMLMIMMIMLVVKMIMLTIKTNDNDSNNETTIKMIMTKRIMGRITVMSVMWPWWSHGVTLRSQTYHWIIDKVQKIYLNLDEAKRTLNNWNKSKPAERMTRNIHLPRSEFWTRSGVLSEWHSPKFPSLDHSPPCHQEVWQCDRWSQVREELQCWW